MGYCGNIWEEKFRNLFTNDYSNRTSIKINYPKEVFNGIIVFFDLQKEIEFVLFVVQSSCSSERFAFQSSNFRVARAESPCPTSDAACSSWDDSASPTCLPPCPNRKGKIKSRPSPFCDATRCRRAGRDHRLNRRIAAAHSRSPKDADGSTSL